MAQAATASRPSSTTRRISITDAVERLRSRIAARCAARARRDARPSRRVGPLRACSSWRPARFASGSPRGSPSRRWPTRSGSRSKRSRRSGTACGRPSPSCSTGPRGAAEQPTARDVPVFRPFMLAHPLEETKVSLDDYAAEWKWDGIRVQLVHAGGETRLYSRTGDDISRQLPRRRRGVRDAAACSTASCWCAARTRASPTCTAARRRASTRFSSGSAARTSAPKMLGALSRLRPALRHLVRRRRGSARAAAGPSGARGSKRFAAQLDPERFDVSQLIEADELRGARGAARRRPRRGDRGHHAQAPRQPLCRRAAAPACGTNGSAIR